ncbi:MAG: hypothetical protein MPN21_14945 [Thermoanaerobaculia bacterium]|nr:hypothetical protein [Thermoanaerobaculia bacterium]
MVEADFQKRWDNIFPQSKVSAWALANRSRNVFGFLSSFGDYRDLQEEDFVVGIFGGSVAAQMAIFGGDILVNQLEERDVGRVRLVNGAAGGFKQPQQLMVFSQMLLLGVPFDVVVNLDGLNEIRTGSFDASDGYHPLFPSRSQYLKGLAFSAGAASRSEIELAGGVIRAQRLADTWRLSLAGRRWLQRSHLVRALVGSRIRMLEAEARNLEFQMQRLPSGSEKYVAELGDPCLSSSSTACMSLIGDIWKRSSLAMAAIAHSEGIAYYHFLQPNQYVEGSKPFTDEERRIALRETSLNAEVVRVGYPVLRERGLEIKSRGVSFFDLTGVYLGREETIYRDSCCHVNWQGNQILGAAIGERIYGQAH